MENYEALRAGLIEANEAVTGQRLRDVDADVLMAEIYEDHEDVLEEVESRMVRRAMELEEASGSRELTRDEKRELAEADRFIARPDRLGRAT